MLGFALAGKKLVSHLEFVEAWSYIWLGQIYFSFACSPQANPFDLDVVFTPKVWLFWDDRQPEVFREALLLGLTFSILSLVQWPVADVPALPLSAIQLLLSTELFRGPLARMLYRNTCQGFEGNFCILPETLPFI